MGKKLNEMSKEELIKHAVDMFLGFTGDEHTPLDKFAEDAEFMDVTRPVKKVFKGKQEIATFLQDYAGMSGWELDILHAAATEGNVVGIRWIWRSVHDVGPYDGVPPRGIKTEIHGSSWLAINEDGLIAQQTDIWNKDHLMHQLCGP